MSQLYYQLTGFQTQIRWFAYDDKRLAESIAGRSSLLRSPSNPQVPVELILGIKQHGTSHLLIAKEKAEQIAKSLGEKHPQGPPLSVANFESLSPILFYNVEDLGKKISSLKPRGEKNRGDTSQANRGYDKARDDFYRGAFEHGRLLYRILNNSVDAQKFSIDDVSWSKNIHVQSFVFNTKGIDDRNSAEKIKNPIVLDVGFCDATTPSLLPDSNPTHLVDAGNTLLGGKGKKAAFRHHGGSDKIVANAIPARIRELFKDHLNSTEAPMILLVYHEEETINYIRNMGVDVSAWRSGLRTLLFPDRLQNLTRSRDRSPPRRYSNASRPVDHRQSPNSHRRPNSRSRSPRRNSMSYSSSRQHTSASSSRISSTPYFSQRTYAPVYVVDVRQLYKRLMQVNSERLIEVISAFGLGNADGWCAGNEAVSIIDIWRSMVSGVSIDEQRAQREVGLNQPPLEPKVDSSADAGPSSHGGGDDSDDEGDPNDIIIRNPGPSAAPQNGGAYSNLDESDYESQSDGSD